MNQIPLIRDPSVVAREVGEIFQHLYEPISTDAEWYRSRIRETGIPLDTASIQRFINRLEYANRRTNDILGHINAERGSLYPLSDADVAAIADEAWLFQISADKMVEQLLRYTSSGMKYFGETFRYIEKLDPYRFDKLTYQEKLELLEIAGIERDRAMQMERPRLIKASYRHQKNIQSLVRDILEFRHFWNSSEYPLSSQHFKDEASVTHPSLGDTRSARESPSKFSRLGGLEYKKAIQNQSYVKEVDTILSEFRFEEQELINRLNRWLGMKKMYLPADISEFLPGAISSKKP